MIGFQCTKMLLKIRGGVGVGVGFGFGFGFDSKAVNLARSTARCWSTAAPAIWNSNQSAAKSVNYSDFTISYLVDSCGLTEEAATSAAKRFNLKSAEKPDKVLSLLRGNGFNDGDISRLLVKRPTLIVMDPGKFLRPKLNLLASLGPTQDFLVKVLLRCPGILQNSMDKTLVPSLEFLRSMLKSDENVLKAMSRCSRLLWFKLPPFLGPNVVILRDVGMSDDLIASFLKDRPTAFLSSAAKLRVLVDRVIQMGFDPKRRMFVEAIGALAAMSDKTWEQKVRLFKKWGWSDDEVVSAFKKAPLCMTTLEKKIDAIMDYFVNKLKLDPSFVAKTPKLVTLSLEKRIIPRCSLIRYLQSKGVLGAKDFTLSVVLTVNEDNFFRKFVTKYEETLPELLDLYTQYKDGAVSGNLSAASRP
ncbi:hypothetical protein QQ045_008868 [Rhodiola kirilowii]